MHTWNVVHATGIVQAVYGAALSNMAYDKAKSIPLAQVSVYCGPKPVIGQQFLPITRIEERQPTPIVRHSIIRDS
jgi:hypothetical protein